MKKKFLILLAIMLFISPLSAYVSASDSASTIEYLDDGTYLETVPEDVPSCTDKASNQTTITWLVRLLFKLQVFIEGSFYGSVNMHISEMV